MTWSIFFIRGFLLLALGTLASCAPSNDVQNKSNAEFQKRFSADVSKINTSRLPPPPPSAQASANVLTKQQNNTGKFANPNEILGISGAAQYSSASVNTAKFALKQEEDFSPDEQNLAAAKAAGQNKLPDDMFDLVYNPAINTPFVVSGLEFDTIKIPDRDYYGVASTLNDKRYLLAGNQILQKNIDDVIKSQSAEDIEFSEVLIKEQRQLKKQQKLAKIFGDDSSFTEKEKVTVKKEEKPAILDEALRKAIALQIIQQNITHNSAATKNKAAVAQNVQAAQQQIR
jgi:hypothetical protein